MIIHPPCGARDLLDDECREDPVPFSCIVSNDESIEKCQVVQQGKNPKSGLCTVGVNGIWHCAHRGFGINGNLLLVLCQHCRVARRTKITRRCRQLQFGRCCRCQMDSDTRTGCIRATDRMLASTLVPQRAAMSFLALG